jgi:hypothetical protein
MMGQDDVSWQTDEGTPTDWNTPPKTTDWGWLTSIFGGVKDVYTGWQGQQTAEELKEAAEAKLAAERARLEAERLRLQQQDAAPTPMVLGVPRDYLIVGGVGLAVIATIVAFSR